MSPLSTSTIDAYVDAHTTPLEPLLQKLHAATYAEMSSPQMIAGPTAGQFLRFLVRLVAPRLVVEIGTFTGYSALAMAGGLVEGGRIVTCEVSPERARFAQSWFDRSPLGEQIDVRVGPALETLAGLDAPYDFVFIDADKEGYTGYYEAVVPKLSPAGLIVVDNTLRDGDVAQPLDEGDRSMAAFNDHVQDDPRTENVVLTVRDGITVIRLR